MIAEKTADLDAEAIAARVGTPVSVVRSTRSTQDDARAAAQTGAPHGAVFVADVQEGGRGRQGRAWVSPAGTALLASVVLRPRVDVADLPALALVVGLAVSDAAMLRALEVSVKWPNDVLARGRKLAGVLVETSLRGARADSVIAGFGINVRRASFSPEIAARAISLEEAGAAPSALDRGALLVDVLGALAERLRAFERGGLSLLLPELRARDTTRGRQVEGEGVSGIADGIADDGRLRVRTTSGVALVGAGEIRFRT